MLQIQTVEPDCLALLKEIMALGELKTFRLAGGTALSLRLGHRVSIDLDLFTNDLFEASELITTLKLYFNNRIVIKSTTKFGVFAFIDNIKVDFMFRYEKFISGEDNYGVIRLASLEDIAAMKMLATINRNSKKDYYDLFELLETFTFQEIIILYSKIYINHDLGSLLKSLTDFQGTELEEDPITLKSITWEMVKKKINNNISNYINILQQKKVDVEKRQTTVY